VSLTLLPTIRTSRHGANFDDFPFSSSDTACDLPTEISTIEFVTSRFEWVFVPLSGLSTTDKLSVSFHFFCYNTIRAVDSSFSLRPDTRDWQIGGGTTSATDAYMNFESFLGQASTQLSTGFIVLAHDLYQQSVDLAVDYILPM